MKLLIIFGGTTLIVLFFFWVVPYLIRLKRKRMPGLKQKMKIFVRINKWKKMGFNYEKRLELLIKQGHDKNVANILMGEAEYMSNSGPDQNKKISSKRSK